MNNEPKQLVSIKRAKRGSTWSNRMPDRDLFKNIGGIHKTVVPFSKILKWWPRRVLQNLPKKPEAGYKGFGQEMFHPCNMRQRLEELRADPETADQDHAFWIGHASQLLCLRSGTNIILDPVYCDRASPVSFTGPKRKYPPATSLDELPKIDIMLVSHNHYDHLDKVGVKGVYQRNPDIRIVVPLRMNKLMEDWGIPASSITQMDWQDEIIVKDVVICCTPAQHWGKHGLFDNNEVLWCGWVIGWERSGKEVRLLTQSSSDSSRHAHNDSRLDQYSPAKESDPDVHAPRRESSAGVSAANTSTDKRASSSKDAELHHAEVALHSLPDSEDSWAQCRTSDNLLPVDWPSLKTYYFTGDTAFNEVVFELIHARIDHIDMAALPIGAYAPRWFMHGQHIDPESAVKVFKIVNARRAYGVHYGTFELADEPLDEPPRVLQEALSIEEVSPEDFAIIPMGEYVSF